MESAPKPCVWVLKPLQISRLQDSFEITADGATLGRSETNSIAIPEAGFPFVSSHHARVRLADGVPVVEDLGSKNGTLLNGTAVTTGELHNGDILQLGSMGPRFAVVCTDMSGDTLPTIAVPAEATPDRDRDLTQSSLDRIKRGLGIPVDSDVGTLVRRGRRIARNLWTAVLVVVIGGGIAFWVWSEQGAAEAESLRAQNRQLAEQLSAAQSALQQQHVDWESRKKTLEADSTRLTERLMRLEKDAGTSASELAGLRKQLADTDGRLERYNPLTIEQGRLEGVRRVTRAVVFVETRMFFRHESGKLLHVEPAAGGSIKLNLKDKGEPYAFEGSGSGFVVTKHGWILTNAHVVEPDAEDGPFSGGAGSTFKSEIELAVVFSGTSKRHAVRKVKSVHQDDVDLALLKIEPFEGMPYIDGIDLALPVPEPMSEVYLSGFPLGRMAVQQGEIVIASTFKGILSRVVPPYLQVDAAVHPGNSGGPVVDNRGNVLGIATRVQRTPGGPYAPTIGYITPVAALAAVWPPPAATRAK